MGVMVVAALVFFRVRSVIAPLALATLLAYILNPLVTSLKRARLSRTGATIIVYLLLLLVLVAVPSILAPPLIQQVGAINVDFVAISNGLRSLFDRYQTVEVLGFPIDLSGIYEDIQGELARVVNSVASYSFKILSGAVTSALWLILTLVLSFYLLRDWEKISAYLEGLVPPDYREDASELRREIERIWDSFLRGQIILSLVVGVVTGATMWIVGVKNALLLGILAGVLEIVPNLGPVLAALPAIALAFFQGSLHLPISNGWFALLVVGLYVAIQQVENNYLVPRIIGRSVNLHPVVVIVGAIGGAIMGGSLGIFLAAPVLGSARILGGYLYRKLLEREPVVAVAQGEASSKEAETKSEGA